MEKLENDFISKEAKSYKWHLGRILASSLSGFIAGIIVASLFFYTLFDLTWKAASIAGL